MINFIHSRLLQFVAGGGNNNSHCGGGGDEGGSAGFSSPHPEPSRPDSC